MFSHPVTLSSLIQVVCTPSKLHPHIITRKVLVFKKVMISVDLHYSIRCFSKIHNKCVAGRMYNSLSLKGVLARDDGLLCTFYNYEHSELIVCVNIT